jgi:TonB family protein
MIAAITVATDGKRKGANRYVLAYLWRPMLLIASALLIAGCVSQDRPLQLSSGAAPIYPPQAQAQGVEGEVKVKYDVTDQGTVINAVVVKSESGQVFDTAALNAVTSWKFTPARRDGVAIAQKALVSKLSFQVGTRVTDEPRAARR